jgi:hypothetical protein
LSATRRFLRLGLLLALLAVALGVSMYWKLEYPSTQPPKGDITLFFPYGTSTKEIFRELAAPRRCRPASTAS